jgi:hypothetical protein
MERNVGRLRLSGGLDNHGYRHVDHLETKVVTVLIRDGDIWVEQVYRDEQQAVSLVLPGLAIRLPDLWPEIEDDQPDDESANGSS